MSEVKHLLFDCDGVLVDTEFTAAIKMTQALNNLSVDLSVDYYLQNLSGTTFSSIVHWYFNNSLSEFEVLQIINKVEDEVAAEVKLIDGVADLLADLPVSKSVVSNSSVRTVERALETTGIKRYFFSKIFSSELVKQAKPAPDIYLLAINSLGYNASEIIVVEDSISGAKAALTAGLRVIGFVGASHIQPGHGQRLLDLGVRQIAESMIELQTILANSNS
jgi:HAD superfamily hydrolase (TIGR01509 family)